MKNFYNYFNRYTVLLCLFIAAGGISNASQLMSKKPGEYNVSAYNIDKKGALLTCIADNLKDTIKISISFPFNDAVELEINRNDKNTKTLTCHPFSTTDNDDSLILAADSVTVKISKQPYSLSVLGKNDNVLFHNTGVSYTDNKFIRVECPVKLDEHFYGFGEKFNGLDQRGRKVIIELNDAFMSDDDSTYKSIPFFISSSRYGVFINSTKQIVFDMGNSDNEKYRIEIPGKHAEMYVFANQDPLNIITQYTSIAGMSRLVPEWTLEPWLSRRRAAGWNNPFTAETDIDSMIAHNFRLGVILWEGIDNIFYGPDSAAMFRLSNKWRKMGIKQVGWAPTGHIHKSLVNINEEGKKYYIHNADGSLSEGGRVAGGYYYVDPTNPEAMNWWIKKYCEPRFLGEDNKSVPGALNLDGTKIDFSELFPKDDTDVLTYEKRPGMHNEHAVLFASQIYNWLKKNKPEGGITWVRGGGLGIQTVGFTWGGDRGRTFEQLLGTIRASLAVSICGVSLIGHDLGGYMGDGSAEADKVYIRGVQYAAFSPSFHDHGSAPGPWEQNDYGIDNYSFYSRLRYNLIPYLYHYVKVSSLYGIPMMRSLFLIHPEDKNTFSIEDEYYLGDNLLVAPVVTMSNTRSIYLPAGNWIDFWNNDTLGGGKYINYYSPLNRIPVFVKAGSILPLNMNKALELAGNFPFAEKNNLLLTFRFFKGPDADLSHYADSTIYVSKITSGDRIILNIKNIYKDFALIADGVLPANVSVNNKDISTMSEHEFDNTAEGWRYSEEDCQALIKIKYSEGIKEYTVKLERVQEKHPEKNRQLVQLSRPEIIKAQGWNESIDISFKLVKDAEYCILKYKEVYSGEIKTVSDITDSPVTIHGLKNNSSYNITISAAAGDIVSPESGINSIVPAKHTPFFIPDNGQMFINAEHTIKAGSEDSTSIYTYAFSNPKKSVYTIWVRAFKKIPHNLYFRWYKVGSIEAGSGDNYFTIITSASYDISRIFLTENSKDQPAYKAETESEFIEKSINIENEIIVEF